MRLIDADKLIDYFYYGINDRPIIDGCNDRKIIDIIKEQPTAYDLDKVVERLKKETENLTSWLEDMVYQCAINKAIEIAKGGN